LERNVAHTPLFQQLVMLHNQPLDTLELPGLRVAHVPGEPAGAKLDLTLAAVETAAGLVLSCSFDRDLFDAATVARFQARFAPPPGPAVAAPGPAPPDRPPLPAAERHQLLAEWGGERERLAVHGGLHEVFSARAAAAPEATAVVCGSARLTYGELEARANRL